MAICTAGNYLNPSIGEAFQPFAMKRPPMLGFREIVRPSPPEAPLQQRVLRNVRLRCSMFSRRWVAPLTTKIQNN